MRNISIKHARRLHIAKSAAGMYHVWSSLNQVFFDAENDVLIFRCSAGIVDRLAVTDTTRQIVRNVFFKCEQAQDSEVAADD